MEVCLSKLPLGWNGAYRHFRHPLDYLGADGGGGVGAGPGLTVGAALALKGSGRMVVGIVGDGDFLMGNTAIWTAAHYKLPCLFLVANNRSFYNDEMHQERVAKERGRPVENKWIGQRSAGGFTNPRAGARCWARCSACARSRSCCSRRSRASLPIASTAGGSCRRARRSRRPCPLPSAWRSRWAASASGCSLPSRC